MPFCKAKQEEALFISGCHPQVTVEQLWKLSTAKEKEPRRQRRPRWRKRERVTETEVKQHVNRRGSLNGECWCGVKVCFPRSYVVPLATRARDVPFQTGILSTRSVSNKNLLLINTTECFTLPFYITEILVSRSNLDSYSCFFGLWKVAKLLAVAVSLMQIVQTGAMCLYSFRWKWQQK